MDTARNVAVLREAYRLWHETKGGSVDHWMSIVAENVDFRSPGAGAPQIAFSFDRSKRDELRAYFDAMLADWQMIHFTVSDLIAEGDLVVMHGVTAWRSRVTGRAFETRKVDVWRFGPDGKAIEFSEYFDTAGAIAAATP